MVSESNLSASIKVKKKKKEPQFDMKKITQLDNEAMSKLMTHELVSHVTKTINEVHCTEVESRVKEIIVALLDKPLKNMALNEELLSKYGETARRNVRRVHEMEYIVQKF